MYLCIYLFFYFGFQNLTSGGKGVILGLLPFVGECSTLGADLLLGECGIISSCNSIAQFHSS